MPSTRATPARVMRPSPRVVWLLAAGAVLVHLVVLYWPVVTVTGPVSWTDKVVHLLVFAVPTFLIGWLTRIWLAALVFAVHAPMSELLQGALLPGRSADPWDAALDLAGVALGVLTLVVAARRSGRSS